MSKRGQARPQDLDKYYDEMAKELIVTVKAEY